MVLGGDACVALGALQYRIPIRVGARVDVVWAFMVVRHGSPGDFGLSTHGELAHHPRATIKALPATLHHPRPYGCR